MGETTVAEAPNPWVLARESWSLAATYARSAGEGWLSGSETVLHRWGQWWRDLAERPERAPLLSWQRAEHRLAFWREVWRRQTPGWSTANAIRLERPFARLRDFSQGVQDGVPVFLLPPQAGHASTIVDYSERQSQVQTLRAAGLPRVYVAEWLSATHATRTTGIDDYLQFMRDAVAQIGGPVHLIGDCQGGWQAAIYAALFPEDVRTLTLAGAPIDFQAGDGAIKQWVNFLCGTTGMTAYQTAVAANGGVLPGRAILNGFSLINPQQDFERYSSLFDNLADPAFLSRHQWFETWYTHTQDLPGVFYLWLVENLFWKNRLVDGTLTAMGRTVDLRAVSMPLALLAGAKDHITPPQQVFGILPHVSTPREQVLELTADGGHLGLFMGSSALANEWPLVAAHLLQYGG
jgi:poly(3-hydroxybutyrate) depolymerase